MKTWQKFCAMGLLALTSLAGPTWAAPDGTAFKTPQEAVKAFHRAVKARDSKALSALFGSRWKQLAPGDAAEREKTLKSLSRLLSENWTLANTQGKDKVLRLGMEGWSFPVPIDKTAKGWQFDTEKGLVELDNRRIGRNELLAMETCQLLVKAQELYHSIDRDGDASKEYATELFSWPTKQDGLYWPVQGKELSPMDQLLGDSSAFFRSRQKGDPWFGYYFHLLDVSEAGFTLVAWPAEYEETGVMSFWTDQTGALHEKNLGPSAGIVLRELDSAQKADGWELVGNTI